MTDPSASPRPTAAFWLSVPFAAAFTWGVHELMHYVAGVALGYEMWMSMNQAGPVEGKYAATWHAIVVSMAGPFVTYLQAGVAFWLIRTRELAVAYPFLFLAWFTRTLAFVVGFKNPNDEMRTSIDLGLPAWALPAVVVTALLALTVLGSRALRFGWRTNLGLYIFVSVITAAIVFGDPVVGRLIG